MGPHTQPVRALQKLKVRQFADGGGQRPAELILLEGPAYHVGKGARIGQTRLPNTKQDTQH